MCDPGINIGFSVKQGNINRTCTQIGFGLTHLLIYPIESCIIFQSDSVLSAITSNTVSNIDDHDNNKARWK